MAFPVAVEAPKPKRKPRDPFKGESPEAMMAAGCTGCPLALSAKAKPSGAMPCDVYMLGEAPGEHEARRGEPFVGKSGRLLRSLIPPLWKSAVRYNNVVMSWPPKIGKQSAPSVIAMQHCRGFLIEDIERAKPKAIFGFGNTPLAAITGQTGITRFAGHRMPIQIGSHHCWYFAFVHPASILHAYEKDRDSLTATLGHQIKRAFAKIDRLPPPVIEDASDARAGVHVLTSAKRVIDWLQWAAEQERVGFDYETTGLSPFAPGARILSVALGAGEMAVGFALDHREAQWTENERSAIWGALKAMLEAPVVKIAHNAQFEMLWTLHFFGKAAVRPGLWGDSLAQAFLLDSRPRAHSLDHLCLIHYGLPLKNVSSVDVTNLDNEPLREVLTYNAMDAKYCLRLWERQQPRLLKQGLLSTYDHHMARVAALVRMQAAGLPVDAGVNAKLTKQYRWRQRRIESKLAKLPAVQAFRATNGWDFNVGSPKQVAAVVGIDTARRYTTDEKTLLGINTPEAKAVLEWRGVSKVLSTYLVPFGAEGKGGLVHDGLLHPVIGTTGTRTWRTNANAPNIQNFPKRDTSDRIVRSQIVARPGTRMVCVDYSSIQARNVAMESQDPTLVQAFINRYDMHQDWSERIQRRVKGWAKGRDQKALRNAAKNELVFPLFFGAQPSSVAGYLGVDTEHGYKLYEEFWNEFPDIKQWHNKLHAFYEKHHYVTGLSKFRRHAPISENQLINSPIQADEALLVCEAMIRLSQYEDDDLQPVCLIHDDLMFMLPERRVDECTEIILHEMLRLEHTWLNVPLAVEVSTGYDWCNLSKVGQFESVGDGGFVQI